MGSSKGRAAGIRLSDASRSSVEFVRNSVILLAPLLGSTTASFESLASFCGWLPIRIDGACGLWTTVTKDGSEHRMFYTLACK